jgi:threonine aldolase
MRQAMAEAVVGDDVYGDDPTAQALETRVAELLGKEAALFVPSGTMANQIALWLHCRPGDEVVVGQGAHLAWYESGAGAALAGVQFAVAAGDGRFDPDALDAAVKPDRVVHPRTRLVALENTHNRSGGRVFPPSLADAVARRARHHGLAVHLDGARIWNAAVATGCSPAELAAPADTVSVCFSKGLGAPIGSALVGEREAIGDARRIRKMLGGGMRQVGVVCAAALYALSHHRDRLEADHRHARWLAEAMARTPGVLCDAGSVDTNIVNVTFDRPVASEVAERAAAAGVWVGVTGAACLRLVTHLDLSEAAVGAAADVLREATAAALRA